MKKSIRTIATVLLVLIFLFSTARFLGLQRDNAAGREVYSDALALASSGKTETAMPQITEAKMHPAQLRWVVAQPEEEDPYIRQLEELNLDALREINPQVVGWILIPDTKINYPILQGEDNDFYLNHTWEGKENSHRKRQRYHD